MTTLSWPDVTRDRLLAATGLATLVVVLGRVAFFDHSPGARYFHGHGYCYLWQPDLVAAHVASDALIGLSYVAISLTLVYLVTRAREHLPFSWMFIAFGTFIIACGATHFMEIWTLWTPVFWLSADVKIITAVASVATAVLLPPLVPKVLGVIEEAKLSERRRVALAEAHDELERRVAARTAELQSALNRAEEANRAKEAFLSTVSHELRTPLNAIVGWSRMLATGASADLGFMARGLQVIDRNARMQAQLVEELLDISRVTAGTLRLQMEPLDVTRTVREALEIIRPAADAKRVAVDASMPAGAVPVVGDTRRLQQVIWNLLSNAVKFTPEGRRIAVAVKTDGARAQIEVSDTGIGIEREFLPRVFDRFSQADPSPTRRHQGLGIGLAIARHLVELHGGTITAESEGPGHGATFRVELPLRAEVEPAVPPLQREGAALPRVDGVRVLVVDDDADARGTLGTILERAGALVTTADSADAALHQLHITTFDVILSDIAMPGEDGLTLLRRIRQATDCRLQQLPAIAVTAYAGEDERDKALAAGFQLHLPKPVTPEELVHSVKAVVPCAGPGWPATGATP